MGGNFVSCHSGIARIDNHDRSEAYGYNKPIDKPSPAQPKCLPDAPPTRSEVHWDNVSMNGKVNNNHTSFHQQPTTPMSIREPVLRSSITPDRYSSSAPSTPTSNRRKYDPPPKPPRLRSYAEAGRFQRGVIVSFSSSDSPKNNTLRDFVRDRSHSADMTAGDGSPSGSYVVLPTIKPHIHSSLLELPVVEITAKVFSLTKDILRELIDPNRILTQLTDNGLITPDMEMKLMGCRTTQRRCDLLLDSLEQISNEVFDGLCEILRSTEGQTHLADLLEVHHGVIKTVCDSRDRNSSADDVIDEVFGSSDFLSEECAIFQIDINYCDNQTGNMVSVEEAKQLSTSLEDHFEELSKSKRHSFYETMAIRDWNANYSLNRITPVVVLDLYNQKLGDEGVKEVCKLLSQFSCIRELCTAKNSITSRGMSYLGDALTKNHGLSKLDVRLNAFGDEGISLLADGLKRNRSLRTLNVTCCAMTSAGCNILAEALSKNVTLTDLDVGFNDLQGSCKTLAEELKNNAYVKRLRMRRTNLDIDGYAKLFKSLRINSRLQMMDISSNCLLKSGASLLADLLVSNRTLQEINLEKCDLDGMGASCIARALKANTVLKTLDVSMNKIGDDGALSLADSLKYNRTLEILSMNMCGITNIGFLSLLSALKVNQTVKTMKLCYNHIGHDEDDDVDDYEIYYRTLEILYDRLGTILHMKDNFRLLLWGNSLEETFIPTSPTSTSQ